MTGPRKRVGVIVPSVNTTVEDDLRAFLPQEVGYHIARLRLRKIEGAVTQQSLKEAGEEAPDHAGFLADALVDAIAFNCTGSCAEAGPAANERMAERMRATTGLPATTTMLALVDALRTLRIKRLVHVCPFVPAHGEAEARYLRDADFDVLETAAMGHHDAHLVAQLEPAVFVDFAAAHDRRDADAIFLACANARTFEAIESAEARLGKPVITSNQVVMWALLKLVGVASQRVHGGGTLFAALDAAA